MPTTLHNPTSQLVNLNEKLFMIDCGEGTQLQLRRYKARLNKLHSIFISHLHGDHLFGLPGLLATLALLGRTGDLHIYAHKEVELFLNPFLKYFGNQFPYKIIVIHLDPLHHQLIFENNAIRVFSFPLKHRIPTNGFRFEEKERPRHIKREMIDFYNIPLSKINEIKMGADFETSDGKLVENEILTTPRRRRGRMPTVPIRPIIRRWFPTSRGLTSSTTRLLTLKPSMCGQRIPSTQRPGRRPR